VEFVAGGRPEGSRVAPSTEAGWPTCYIYDTVAGGVGFAERCHSRHADLLGMAAELVDGCDCDGGCPSCVGPAPARLDGRAATRRLLVIAR
jgi:DEAD/DEAH box helicase domain-containing protein